MHVAHAWPTPIRPCQWAGPLSAPLIPQTKPNLIIPPICKYQSQQSQNHNAGALPRALPDSSIFNNITLDRCKLRSTRCSSKMTRPLRLLKPSRTTHTHSGVVKGMQSTARSAELPTRMQQLHATKPPPLPCPEDSHPVCTRPHPCLHVTLSACAVDLRRSLQGTTAALASKTLAQNSQNVTTVNHNLAWQRPCIGTAP